MDEMSRLQPTLFEGARMTLDDSLELTAQSILAYADNYRHWAVAFSGGKDSSATVTVIAHMIKTGRIPRPESLTVLYGDTRMELPPLQASAMEIMKSLHADGVRTKIVLPAMDDRFMVYMLGRGVPPPSNTFRWCTAQLKIEPMLEELKSLRESSGEKLLMLTGVRLGESAARDARIALSCSKNGAECGQGWYQQSTPESIADTLAPLLHWRVCHVWDWLRFFAPDYGYPTAQVADAYGGEEAEEVNARTGCVGCNLASRDTALERIIKNPAWHYLTPLLRLRPLYAEFKRPQNRHRKDGSERRQDGSLSTNPMRLGPLTLEARLWGLNQILEIQRDINTQAIIDHRPQVWLIDGAEEARIRELIDSRTYPNKWSVADVVGDIWLDEVIGEGVVQPLIFGK
jgi:DNA sulfur modification protein DndC